MGTNGIGCTEWERDFDPKTEQPYRAEIEDEMSREAWGDEGDVPQHGRDTAAFQELSAIRDRLHKWTCDFKSELNPDEFERASEAIERIDDTLELLDVKL